MEALKHQVSDQPQGVYGLPPPDILGHQLRSGPTTYKERVGGRLEEGSNGGEASTEHVGAGGGESRADLLEVRSGLRKNTQISC